MLIREIFDTIKNTGGSKKKQAILEANLNPTIETIFNDTYDQSRKYFVHKYNKNWGDDYIFREIYNIDENYNEFHEMLDALASRKVTGNAAIAMVEETIAKFIEDDRPILHAILARNLKIGVSSTSFNKHSDEKIEKFKVALACNLDKIKGVDPLDGTWYASRKLDGCVDYYSIIDTEFGPMTIGELVEKNILCKVKSWDGKNIVYKPIISNFKGITDKQWYSITLENGKTIKITENDKLMTDNGWKSVFELKENDKIMCD